MTEHIHAFNYRELLKDLDEDLQAQLDMLSLNQAAHTAVSQYLVGDLQNLRFNMIADQIALGDAWRAIRSNDAVLDTVLDLTTTLRMRADCLQDDGWAQLNQLVVDALCVFNHPQIDEEYSTLDDSAERDRFVDLATAQHFVGSNPWLVTLFLLRQSPVLRGMISNVAKLNQRASRPATAPAATAG